MKNHKFHTCFKMDGKHKVLKIIGMVIGGICLAVIFALLFGIVVQYLWNWLMPELFGLQTITFLQAFAIVLLAKILFGFNHGGHKEHHSHGKCDDDKIHLEFECNTKNGKYTRHYKDFWEKEGKDAFEKYVEKIESEDSE